MSQLLPIAEAAAALLIETDTLRKWLRRSDAGILIIRGERATINYLQGGARGQGRIMLEESEIERIKELMRVRPVALPRPRMKRTQTSHITAVLGRPE